jgi:hypothetical protein
MDLLYYCFNGDIILRQEKVDLSAQWGWVPILDFAIGLDSVMHALSKNDAADLDFTESDERLRFERVSDLIHITATYAPGVIQVSLIELRQQVQQFVRKVFIQLGLQFPGLQLNPDFKNWEARLLNP